jgi:DNA-directed RNA polymerase subunit K/omega
MEGSSQMTKSQEESDLQLFKQALREVASGKISLGPEIDRIIREEHKIEVQNTID